MSNLIYNEYTQRLATVGRIEISLVKVNTILDIPPAVKINCHVSIEGSSTSILLTHKLVGRKNMKYGKEIKHKLLAADVTSIRYRIAHVVKNILNKHKQIINSYNNDDANELIDKICNYIKTIDHNLRTGE